MQGQEGAENAHDSAAVVMNCEVCLAVATRSFRGVEPDELTVLAGQALVVERRFTDGWCVVQNEDGETGLVPANHIDIEDKNAIMCTTCIPAPSPNDAEWPVGESSVDEQTLDNSVLQSQMAEYVENLMELIPRESLGRAMPGSNGSVTRLYTPRSTASTVQAMWAKDEYSDVGGEDTERPRSNRYTRKSRSGLWSSTISQDTDVSQAETGYDDDAIPALWDSEWLKRGRLQQQTMLALETNPTLRWEAIGAMPPSGTEIFNHTLVAALRRTKEFSPEEWMSIGAKNVTPDCYIKVGDNYFQPAQSVAAKSPLPAPVGGRYLSEEDLTDLEQVFCPRLSLLSCEYMRSLMAETNASETHDLSFSTYCSELHPSREVRNEPVMNTHLSGGKSESQSLAENWTQCNAMGIGVDLASVLPEIADDEPAEAQRPGSQNRIFEF